MHVGICARCLHLGAVVVLSTTRVQTLRRLYLTDVEKAARVRARVCEGHLAFQRLHFVHKQHGNADQHFEGNAARHVRVD